MGDPLTAKERDSVEEVRMWCVDRDRTAYPEEVIPLLEIIKRLCSEVDRLQNQLDAISGSVTHPDLPVPDVSDEAWSEALRLVVQQRKELMGKGERNDG